MAIGIHLLTGLPILWGTVITVLDTFLFLFLQRWGIRKMEAFIITLVAIIGFSFLVQILIAKPALGDVVGGLMPGYWGIAIHATDILSLFTYYLSFFILSSLFFLLFFFFLFSFFFFLFYIFLWLYERRGTGV